MVLKNLPSRNNAFMKFLKNQNEKDELEYKTCNKLFESIKKCSKKLHFSTLILKYKHNIKKTWGVIKESKKNL